MRKKFKIALALGGGGVRGFAHIGVLKALEESKIPFDFIVGTSMGAIIGACYCIYQDLMLIEEAIKRVVKSKDIKNLEVFLAKSEPEEKKLIIGKFFESVKSIYIWNTKKYLIDSNAIKDLIKKVIPEDKQFSDLKFPFACVATDLLTGEKVILKEGNLLNAVLASSSIPGIFSPVKLDKKLLADGGIISLVPSQTARKLGGEFVIGVNVEGKRLREEFKSGVDILFQVDQIRAHYLNKLNLRDCDFVIEPQVAGISWADFSKTEFCIQRGYEAGKVIISQLRKKLLKKKILSYFKHFF